MTTFSGSVLKRKREEMHIALEQVAAETRIRLSILQDLEDEEYSELSSSAQIKGFLKLYSEYLGLIEEEPSNDATNQPAQTELEADKSLPESQNSEFQSELSQAATFPSNAREDLPTTSLNTEQLNQSEASLHETQKPTEDAEWKNLLAQLGRELSARRRYLNLDWELISEQTHLHRETIRDLENGDLEAFFAPLEFKKNLQIYARFLNLNVESIMIQYAEALQKRRIENFSSKRIKRSLPKTASPVLINFKRFFTLDLFFGTFLIAGILGFLIWGISHMRQTTSEESIPTETLPAVIDFILTTPTSSEPTLVTEDKEPETVEVPTPTVFFVQNPPEEGLSLSIHARQNVWVRVYSDEKLDYEGRLPAGEVKSVTADETIMLEISNIAGIELAFQGSALEPIYRSLGTPARLFFNSDGMQELPVIETTPQPLTTPLPIELSPGAP